MKDPNQAKRDRNAANYKANPTSRPSSIAQLTTQFQANRKSEDTNKLRTLHQNLVKDHQNLVREHQALSRERDSLKTTLSRERDSLKTTLTEHEKSIKNLQEQVQAQTTDLQDKAKEIKELHEKISDLQDNLSFQANSSCQVQNLRKSDLVQTVYEYTKGVIWRCVKFTNDAKPLELAALTNEVWEHAKRRHADLEEEMNKERFHWIYSGCVKDAISSMRNYTMTGGKKAAKGITPRW